MGSRSRSFRLQWTRDIRWAVPLCGVTLLEQRINVLLGNARGVRGTPRTVDVIMLLLLDIIVSSPVVSTIQWYLGESFSACRIIVEEWDLHQKGGLSMTVVFGHILLYSYIICLI